MFIKNGLKFDVSAEHTMITADYPDGVQFPAGWFLDPVNRAALGITEVPDPVMPDPSLYTYTVNPDGTYTATAIPAATVLANAKADKLAVLIAACKSQILGGFTSSALGATHNYPSGQIDQSNLAASVLQSLYPNLPAGWTTVFWCADSTGAWALQPHTAAQMQQVGVDAKNAITTAITKNDTLGKQVAAATTPDAVALVVW